MARSLWDTYAIIGELDPAWIGYIYDVSHGMSDAGAAEWNVHLRLALSRMKMVVTKDHVLEKTLRGWVRRNCRLGEGRGDFPGNFAMLAKAGYAGPISVAVEYETSDPISAIARDVEFVRRQIAVTYRS